MYRRQVGEDLSIKDFSFCVYGTQINWTFVIKTALFHQTEWLDKSRPEVTFHEILS